LAEISLLDFDFPGQLRDNQNHETHLHAMANGNHHQAIRQSRRRLLAGQDSSQRLSVDFQNV
jgi:hypothetical protein